MRKSMENYKMSDEIKTGHSALGLLMAECEQLRRDLAQAKAENARMAAALEEIDRCATGSMSIVHIQEVARKALRC